MRNFFHWCIIKFVSMCEEYKKRTQIWPLYHERSVCLCRKEDTGMFECVAENEAGQASVSMDVIVYGMFVWWNYLIFCPPFILSYLHIVFYIMKCNQRNLKLKVIVIWNITLYFKYCLRKIEFFLRTSIETSKFKTSI